MSPFPPDVSPAGSVKGYSFRVWLEKNKGKLKQLVSISAGVVVAFTPLIKNTTLSIAAGAAAKLLLDLALDALDFWLTAVPLENRTP